MRRLEIQATLKEAIQDHFPADVSAKFREDQLGDAATAIQDDGKDDYGLIDTVVRDVLAGAADKDLDDISDGVITDTGQWFLEQVRH